MTTNYITNYNEPDQKLRITIPVSVAYGNDPKKVKEMLLDVAHSAIQETGYLLEEPAPRAFFNEFGASGLNFTLYVWARKYDLTDEIKDAVNLQIAGRFASEGIEIPYPHMDVRIKK